MSKKSSGALAERESVVDTVAADVLNGLSQSQKRLSPKYFYDERGSRLFDEITELPEYYLTRTERGIMTRYVDDMARLVGPDASLIEFGSGSSVKTRILLEHLNNLAAYVPVDISGDFLEATAADLRLQFPDIEILPVAADFTHTFDLPSPTIMPVRNVVYFPGSTIGNFEKEDALELLKVMRLEAKEGGALLIGVDLKKDPAIIKHAYNDSAGVTAQFNLNMLKHLNRIAGTDFDVDGFRHDAVYNARDGRIEMRLISTRDQEVTVAGQSVKFSEGEHIITEYSHKYDLEEFGDMGHKAGFEVRQVWVDADELFSIQYLEVA